MKKILLFAFIVSAWCLNAQKPVMPDNGQPRMNTSDIQPVDNYLSGVPKATRAFPSGSISHFQSLPYAAKPTQAGSPLTVYRSQDTGLPLMIKGSLDEIKSEKAVDQINAYLEFLAGTLSVDAPSTAFQTKSAKTDAQGRTHTRMEQFHNGVKIYGAEIIVHQDTENIYLFNGRYFPTPKGLSTTPSITQAQSKQVVLSDLGLSDALPTLNAKQLTLLADGTQETAELVIYHPDGNVNNPRLAWHFTMKPTIVDRYEYFVDAQTNEVLNHYNNVCKIHGESCGSHAHTHDHAHEAAPAKETTTAPVVLGPAIDNATDLLGQVREINTYEVGGGYFLIDGSRNQMFNSVASNFPDEPVGVVWTIDAFNTSHDSNSFDYGHVQDSDNNWNNPKGVSAHYNGGEAFEYFVNTFSRNSINGQGGNIISLINVDEGGQSMENAFWNGAAMFYGDGGQAFFPLAQSLDVAGHEMSHGVVQATANLEYQGESGALNESFADIFGAMIDRDDWQIGEDVVKISAFPSGALRDMQNPNQGGSGLSSPGWQPAHMDEKYTGSQDNGGVHINSGIVNRAYYLFATAVGKDKAEQVYYKALDDYLVKSSQFIDARIAVIQAANDLYGSTEADAAGTAFETVGIGMGEGGDYETDIETNPGEEYILLSDSGKTQLYLADGNGNILANPFVEIAPLTKPSITDDGSVIVFIAADKTMKAIIINDWATSDFTVNTIQSDPIWRQVAVSKDGRLIAAMPDLANDGNDNIILVDDVTTSFEGFVEFELYNPTFTQGVNTGDVVFADFMEFDYSGEHIMYDAFNQLDGSFGQDIEYWDIGFIQVFDSSADTWSFGNVEKLFSGLPENVSVGNPTFSKNSGYIIAFDYIDDNEGTSAIRAANIQSGDVSDPAIFTNDILNFPNYNLADNKVIFDANDTAGSRVLATIGIGADKISPTGQAELIIGGGAAWGTYFGDGNRTVSTVENTFDGSIAIAPNPFQDELTMTVNLEKGTDLIINIHDFTGKQVRSLTQTAVGGLNQVQIDAHGLTAGTYLIQMTSSEGKRFVGKVIKL